MTAMSVGSEHSDGRSARIVVLGMHKSGTTLISRILHRSGVRMVEAESGSDYDAGNHFERLATKQINKALLGCGDAKSFLLRERIDPEAVGEPQVREAEALVRQLDGASLPWGFKDPRSCLTYRFWERILPGHGIVAVFRDPRDLYAHYLTHNEPVAGMGRAALRAWFAHNAVIAEIEQERPGRLLLLEYDALMSGDDELRRLQRFLRRPIGDERVERLRRSNEVRRHGYGWARRAIKLFHGEDVLAMLDWLRELRQRQLRD